MERRQASAPDSGRRGASRSFRGAPRTRLVRVVRPALAGVPLPFYLPEASRKELLRNSSNGSLWIGWLADPRHRSGGRQTKCAV